MPKFTLVEGVGVNDLHHTALGQNCVLQVASQFNFQESPSSQDMPVSSYLNDRTQGPQASIEAAAAALMRKAAYEAGNLPDALSSVLPRAMFETPPLNKYFQLYENGYLNLGSKRDIIGSKPPRAEYVSEADKKLILAAIQQNLKKLLVLPQEVTCEASAAKQLQVFCAAPQLAGGDAKDPINKAICKELVVAQYVAVAQLAVIESRKKGITIPLHLTLVGQGAFENDPSIMKHAMEAVANVVKGENVAVYVHAYKNADKKLFVDQTKDSTEFLKVETMSREDFKNQLQAPQLHTPSNFLQHLSILAKNNDLQGIDKLLKISHFHQNVPNGEAMWIPPRSEHRAINNILATVLAGNNIQMQSDPNNKFNQAICCKGVRLDDANPEQKAMKDLYRQIQQFKADTTNVKDQKVEANATYNHHQEDMVLHGFHEALKKHDDHTNKEQHKDYLQKNQQEVQKQKQKLGS